jgi:hypothetical protein
MTSQGHRLLSLAAPLIQRTSQRTLSVLARLSQSMPALERGSELMQDPVRSRLNDRTDVTSNTTLHQTALSAGRR